MYALIVLAREAFWIYFNVKFLDKKMFLRELQGILVA
jgi:hypothetical protein